MQSPGSERSADVLTLTGSPVLPVGGRRAAYTAKQVIYREGEPAERAYRVRGGLIKLLSHLPNGRARIVRLHAAGHWIGIEGIMAQRYAHTAVSVGGVETEIVPIRRLRHWYSQDSGIRYELLDQCHADLMRADQWISQFSTGAIRARVARLVGHLAELQNGHSADTVELLTVHEMGEILGVTRESVSRVLAAFKRRDVLEKRPRGCGESYRLDSEKLRREALD